MLTYASLPVLVQAGSLPAAAALILWSNSEPVREIWGATRKRANIPTNQTNEVADGSDILILSKLNGNLPGLQLTLAKEGSKQQVLSLQDDIDPLSVVLSLMLGRCASVTANYAKL